MVKETLYKLYSNVMSSFFFWMTTRMESKVVTKTYMYISVLLYRYFNDLYLYQNIYSFIFLLMYKVVPHIWNIVKLLIGFC